MKVDEERVQHAHRAPSARFRRNGGGRWTPRPEAWLAICLFAVGPLVPGRAEAQLRRDPPVQPAAEARAGDLLVGLGVARAADRTFPLSGLRGDLLALGRVTLAYGLAPRTVLEVRGDALRVLRVEGRGPPRVPLDPGVEDGTTADAGDFRVGLLFLPVGGATGWSGGLRFEVTLPNSDEGKGIGTNTTDVRIGVLGSWGGRDVRLTADAGVAILEAPLERFEQNDVFAYAAEVLWRPTGGPWRLAAGLEGRASTRGHVPVGTEDAGSARAGVELHAGRWLLDAGLGVGYGEASARWTLGLGAAVRARP